MAEVIDIAVCDALVIAAVDAAVRDHARVFLEQEQTDGFATKDAYVKFHRTMAPDPPVRRAQGDEVRQTLIYRLTVGIKDSRVVTEPNRLNTICAFVRNALHGETLVQTGGGAPEFHLLELGGVAQTPLDGEHAVMASAVLTVSGEARRKGQPD